MIRDFLARHRLELRLFLIVVLVQFLALLALLWWSVRVGDFDTHELSAFPVFAADSYEYYSAAQALLADGDWFGSPEMFSLMQFRTPGYPLFLVAILWLFHSTLAISLIQILLAALLSVLVYRLGAIYFSGRVGMIAALIAGLEPIAIFQSVVVLSDSLFTLCFIATLYLFFYPYVARSTSIKGLAVAGFLLGCTALIRPIGQWLVVLFLILGVVLCWRRVNNITVRALLSFVLLFVLTLAPWLIRNQSLFGVTALSSFGPYNIYEYNMPLHYAYTHHTSVVEARATLHHQLGITEGNFIDYKTFPQYATVKRATTDYIRQHFFSFTAYHLVKTIPFFLTDGYRELTKTLHLSQATSPNLSDLLLHGEWWQLVREFTRPSISSVLLLFGSGFWLLVNMLMLVGYARVLWRGSWSLKIISTFFALVILYFALLTGPAAQARYRLPVAPLMLILAVYGFSSRDLGDHPRLQRGVETPKLS